MGIDAWGDWIVFVYVVNVVGLLCTAETCTRWGAGWVMECARYVRNVADAWSRYVFACDTKSMNIM